MSNLINFIKRQTNSIFHMLARTLLSLANQHVFDHLIIYWNCGRRYKITSDSRKILFSILSGGSDQQGQVSSGRWSGLCWTLRYVLGMQNWISHGSGPLYMLFAITFRMRWWNLCERNLEREIDRFFRFIILRIEFF